MVLIGGKTKKQHKASLPEFVVQIAAFTNEYALFKTDDEGQLHINWVGDPNAATKFNSKFQAKHRVRELANVPATRVFKQLGAAV